MTVAVQQLGFSIQRDQLARGLKNVVGALPTRAVQPILTHVLVESISSTSLRLRATDLDVAIETTIDAVVTQEGAAAIPGKKLLEVLSKLPSESVSISVEEDLSVVCKRSKCSLAILPASEFPSTEIVLSEPVKLPTANLARALSSCTMAASVYDSSTILNGVSVSVNDKGVLDVVATDGSRLAHYSETLELEEGDCKPFSVIVPARVCGEIAKLLDDSIPFVTASAGRGEFLLDTSNHKLSTRLVQGDYPKYSQLFPAEHKITAVINRSELLRAIDYVSIMSDSRTHLVRMRFQGEDLRIAANTPDVGKSKEEIGVKLEGGELEIALNVRYLIDGLKGVSTEEVRFELNGPTSPVVIHGIDDDKYRYLVMPAKAAD